MSQRWVTIDGRHVNIGGDGSGAGGMVSVPERELFDKMTMEERKEEDAYLVTGNIRHFPVEPFIVTPRQMLDIIVKSIDE